MMAGLSGPFSAREATVNRPNAEVRLLHHRPTEQGPRTPRQRSVYRVQNLERCVAGGPRSPVCATVCLSYPAPVLCFPILSRSSHDPFWATLRRGNPAVPWLIVVTLVLLAMLTFVPPVAHLLGLGAELDVGVPLALGFAIVPVLTLDVIESWVVRRRS